MPFALLRAELLVLVLTVHKVVACGLCAGRNHLVRSGDRSVSQSDLFISSAVDKIARTFEKPRRLSERPLGRSRQQNVDAW